MMKVMKNMDSIHNVREKSATSTRTDQKRIKMRIGHGPK